MNRTLPLAALLAAIVTTPALAEPHVWRIGDGFSIRATGLDLGTTDGRAHLLLRVDAAAAKLCKGAPNKADRLACQAETRAQAVAATPDGLKSAIELAVAERNRTRLAAR